jgi:hypothetical protein
MEGLLDDDVDDVDDAVPQEGRSHLRVGAKYQFYSDSRLAQRGHVPRCRHAARTANHSSLSLRSVAWRAWMVQVPPSSSPMLINRTAPTTCQITVFCGVSRHDYSRSGEVLT